MREIECQDFSQVFYSGVLGEETSYLYRTWLYLGASASAEFFADIALSPMEAAKVKIQTTPGFANTLREAWPKIYKEEGNYIIYLFLCQYNTSFKSTFFLIQTNFRS